MQVFTWDKAGFESTYWKQYYKLRGCSATHARSCKCTESDITYSRQFFEDDKLFKNRAESIINKLNMEPGTDIFVVGCGLGLLMEELKALGMNVWGCDNSQYIHTIKNKEKVAFNIHNISITDSQFVSKIQRATGALWFDVIITEDVLTSHTEYNTIFSNCESMLRGDLSKKNIVHLVDTNAKSPFVSKTIQQWESLNTNHTWVNFLGE